MNEQFDLTASYSQISKYLGCERAYAYQYRDKWRAHAESRAMTLGSVVHHLLDGWWTHQGIPDLDTITEYVIGLEETATVEGCVSIAEHALWIMRRYNVMYARDLETTEVIAVEQQKTFELPLLGERRYAITTKIDKLINSSVHGGIVFMDHKTTGQWPKEDWIDIDMQFSFYFWALRQDGIEPVCALLDTIYTYQWKKKGEVLAWDSTPVEDSFRRALVDRSPAMLDVVAAEAYRACDRMWHLKQGHHEPLRSITPACMWCSFRAPCYESLQGDDAGEQALLREHFDPNQKRPPVVSSSLEPEEVISLW